MNEASKLDVVVIGGGVAGLTAALFATRLGHSTMVVERFAPGGHLVNVENIENFPGFPNGVPGYELGPLIQEQAAKYGAEFQMAEVESVEAEESYWRVSTTERICRAKAVIVAAGSHPKDLGVPGEETLRGQGVSNCASCDGPLFADQVIGVAGGTDHALQETLTLLNYAAQVILFHDQETLSSQQTFKQRVLTNPKVIVRYNTTVEEILGENAVTGVVVRDIKTGEKSQVQVGAMFIYAGLAPNTQFLKNLLRLDNDDRVPTDAWMRTELPGLFAVGDARTDSAGLAITSCGDGATAALAAHQYLESGVWPVIKQNKQ
jgi:thioredoxin reductase (NADPH)